MRGPAARRAGIGPSLMTSTPVHDNDVVIIAGARTPFGNLGGALWPP